MSLRVAVTEVGEGNLSALQSALDSASLIVEGLFGTGLDRAIEGWRVELIELFATGMVFVGVAVVGIAGLRELGLVPLGRWRGRCTRHETVVSRWCRLQTFRPGRDLAVVRVTGTREADVLLLGVGGGWWSGRIGGRELDHFLRCWSSVVRGAGQEGDR